MIVFDFLSGFIRQGNLNNANGFLKTKNMGNLLYLIAVILVISWAVGFFAYNAGGIIHVLLVIAIVAILLRLIRGNSV
jgi:hypothetical protein